MGIAQGERILHWSRPCISANRYLHLMWCIIVRQGEARYFKNEQELLALINEKDEEDCQRNGKAMMEIAGRRYRWSVIANKYEQLY